MIITGVTLDHIPRELTPNGTLSSAPQNFTVYVSITRSALCFDSYDLTMVLQLGFGFVVVVDVCFVVVDVCI